MRTLMLIAVLALSGCRSSLTAPASAPDADASAPQMAPRGQEEWPTRSVELKNVRTALVHANWYVPGADADGNYAMIPASGPAIEFKADLDLHGWGMEQFRSIRYGGNYQWSIVVIVDGGNGDFLDYHWANFEGTDNLGASVVSAGHWVNGILVSSLYHYADLTMHGADLDSLKGRGGVRFTLPLSDFNLTRGPVRWKFFTMDDFWFPIEYHSGITGDGVNVPPVSGWRPATPLGLRGPR